MIPFWLVTATYVAVLVVAFASEILVPAWSGVLIAAAFLYGPFLVARGGADPATRWGLHLARWRHDLGVGLLWCALIFPPFVGGFTLFQRVVFERSPVADSVRLQRWDEALYADPEPEGGPGLGLHARRDDRLDLETRGGVRARVRVEGEAAGRGVTARGGARIVQRTPEGVVVDLPPGGVAQVRRPADCTLTPLAPPDLVLRAPSGEPLAPPGAHVSLEPGLGWWVGFVLWQLALIALSEEFFFRGFLQTELDARWTRRWRLLGAEVGLAWPVTALLFALGHLATTPHPARLLVFFPGLLMGWLRARTGNLIAPLVFHGLANVVMELLVRLHAG